MWKQCHGSPTSKAGGWLARVFISAGKMHDVLGTWKTVDKTLESTLKSGINIKLPTCDDKEVFNDDEDTYLKQN
jgi:hypothetical protein